MSVSPLVHQVSTSTLSLPHKSSMYTLKPRTSTTTLKLRHKPSQLDLIDDTTFTSLPLPPPKRFCSNGTNSTSTTITNSPLNQSIEKFDYNDNNNNHEDEEYYNDDYDYGYDYDYDHDEETEYEFTDVNDSEIVLVEDYFTSPQNDCNNKLSTTGNQNRLWKIFYAISYKYNI